MWFLTVVCTYVDCSFRGCNSVNVGNPTPLVVIVFPGYQEVGIRTPLVVTVFPGYQE